MLRRMIGLVVGIPAIALSVLIGLFALFGYMTDNSPSGKNFAIAFGVVALILFVFGLRLCRSRQHTTRMSSTTTIASDNLLNLDSGDYSWRDHAATEKQKSLARHLGITFTDETSKGELSDLISDAKGTPRFTGTGGSRERRHKQQLEGVHLQLQFMLEANSFYGDDGLYAGFRFVRIAGEPPSSEEKPYVGTFLPLQVAQRHPELLMVETIEYEEVLSDDRLRKGTTMVVGPGKFKKL